MIKPFKKLDAQGRVLPDPEPADPWERCFGHPMYDLPKTNLITGVPRSSADNIAPGPIFFTAEGYAKVAKIEGENINFVIERAKKINTFQVEWDRLTAEAQKWTYNAVATEFKKQWATAPDKYIDGKPVDGGETRDELLGQAKLKMRALKQARREITQKSIPLASEIQQWVKKLFRKHAERVDEQERKSHEIYGLLEDYEPSLLLRKIVFIGRGYGKGNLDSVIAAAPITLIHGLRHVIEKLK